MSHRSQSSEEDVTTEDILALVSMLLPSWLQACNSTDADAIALHESEFGTSADELLLFACAIKLAAAKGKNVYIACGQVDSRDRLLSLDPHVVVYRENGPPSKKKVVRPVASRRNHR